MARKTVERRVEALERLLLAACMLLPDDLGEFGDARTAKLAERVIGESCFWLDFATRGVKPSPTDPSMRLGRNDVIARRKRFRLKRKGDDFSLVPVKKERARAS